MALGDAYVSTQRLRAYILGTLAAESTAVSDQDLAAIADGVSREINRHCGRQFNKTDTASPRLIGAKDILLGVAWVPDFWTTTGLEVATLGGDGTYSIVWGNGDYQLEPLDGVMDGEPGWPYNRIVPLSRAFPRTLRPPLRVTAKWGWTKVPEPVEQAALMLAAETVKLRDAPLGVAGFGEFGVVRVRGNPIAMAKLDKFQLDAVVAG